jgi:nucleoside-diphosphate-sugar epimerase
VRVLIAGCGYLGAALGARLAAEGHAVFGLRRRPEGLPAGVKPIAADLGDSASLRRALPGALDAAVYAAAPSTRTPAAYRAVYVEGLVRLIDTARVPRLLVVSSTSVYGQDGGEWVDEGSPTEPTAWSGRLVLEGEALARVRQPDACAVRLGGLYGPGRARLVDAARAGRLAYQSDPPRYTNRIHRDDAAGALAHLLVRPRRAPVYVAVDREPAREETVQRWLAARVGGPPPREAGGPGRGAGKRASSALLVASGYRFLFPTFREGYGRLAGIAVAGIGVDGIASDERAVEETARGGAAGGSGGDDA